MRGRRAFTDKQRERIVDLYRDNDMSIADLAERFSVNVSTIRTVLTDAGVTIVTRRTSRC